MKLVIQCAGQKDPTAGSLQTSDGRRVYFVAHPSETEQRGDEYFARPDDLSEDGRTWRERVHAYNAAPGANPLGLLPAYKLYKRKEYRKLERSLGADNLFILSAGWGLIPCSFLTPAYNITYTSSADTAFRRRRTDVDMFHDWSMIDCNSSECLVFLGGKDYLPHFAKLTDGYRGPRIAFFNSKIVPSHEGLTFVRYETSTRMNWHYLAAKALLNGTLRLPNVCS